MPSPVSKPWPSTNDQTSGRMPLEKRYFVPFSIAVPTNTAPSSLALSGIASRPLLRPVSGLHTSMIGVRAVRLGYFGKALKRSSRVQVPLSAARPLEPAGFLPYPEHRLRSHYPTQASAVGRSYFGLDPDVAGSTPVPTRKGSGSSVGRALPICRFLPCLPGVFRFFVWLYMSRFHLNTQKHCLLHHQPSILAARLPLVYTRGKVLERNRTTGLCMAL